MSDEMNSEIEFFFFACHDFWYQHLIDIFCLQAYLKSPINYNGKTVYQNIELLTLSTLKKADIVI